MLRLLEDPFLPVTLENFELIPDLAVVGHRPSPLHVCQRQDVCDSIRTEPNFAISGEHSSQLGHGLSCLRVDCQAATYLVNIIFQQLWI